MSGHYCVRVYANGEARHTIRDAEGMAGWVEYNSKWRPGNALFVDGACRGTGAFDAERVAAIETEIRAELGKGQHDLRNPEPMGPQRELIAGRFESYFGYPEEGHRRGFRKAPEERVSLSL